MESHSYGMYVADVAQFEEVLGWIASVHVKLVSQLISDDTAGM